MYELGFDHNKCAGQRQWKHLLEILPERYAYAEGQEKELRELLGDVSILRDRRGGSSRPLPLSVLRTR